MISERLTGILTLIFTFIMGCSGNIGTFIMQSEDDSKVTRQELVDENTLRLWYSRSHYNFRGGP
jgi:hypothetical protein